MWALKVSLLLVGAYLTSRAFTPPNPLVEQDKMINPSELRAHNRRYLYLLLHKSLYILACLSECLVLIARRYPIYTASDYILQRLVCKQPALLAAGRINLTPISLTGCVLLICGAGLRLLCYRELGRLFTYEFSLLNEHKLITTGPYSFVRHPSYLGMLLNLSGILLCHITSGSWMKECGILNTWFGSGITIFWLIITAGITKYAITRSAEEDELLKKEFSDEWKIWAKKVKYRIFPGIL